MPEVRPARCAQRLGRKLNGNDQLIYGQLRRAHSLGHTWLALSYDEWGKLVGCSPRTARRRLARMLADGLVVMHPQYTRCPSTGRLWRYKNLWRLGEAASLPRRRGDKRPPRKPCRGKRWSTLRVIAGGRSAGAAASSQDKLTQGSATHSLPFGRESALHVSCTRPAREAVSPPSVDPVRRAASPAQGDGGSGAAPPPAGGGDGSDEFCRPGDALRALRALEAATDGVCAPEQPTPRPPHGRRERAARERTRIAASMAEAHPEYRAMREAIDASLDAPPAPPSARELEQRQRYARHLRQLGERRARAVVELVAALGRLPC